MNPAHDHAAPELPDDIETLKAMVLAARAETARQEERALRLEAEATRLAAAKAQADARIDRLTAILKALERARFGRKSETLADGQQSFVFEEIETGIAALRAEIGEPMPVRARVSRARKPLPAHLERVEVVIEPDTAPCACGSCRRVKIGEDVSERLDVVPARFRVIVTCRPRYACVACREGIVQAEAQPRLIEGGLPTERLLAHVAVAKYADGLPLYRQEGIYARDGLELGRKVMAGWMGRVGFHLEPLAERILDLVRSGERVFADETTLPTLAPGTGKTKSAWLWTYARNDRLFGGAGPPMVVYRFEDSRAGECPERHLAGFRGLLQTDGYAAYRRLAEPGRAGGPVTLAACWAHLRRAFYELHVRGDSPTATWTVATMASPWAVEERVRGMAPDVRRSARQEHSAPIVSALFERWQAELYRIPGKSKLAEAIRQALRRRADFEFFLADGRAKLDSNTVERAIRPQTVTRKNSLFAGSDGGGRIWATIATLLATAKLNGSDPYAWLALALQLRS